MLWISFYCSLPYAYGILNYCYNILKPKTISARTITYSNVQIYRNYNTIYMRMNYRVQHPISCVVFVIKVSKYTNQLANYLFVLVLVPVLVVV